MNTQNTQPVGSPPHGQGAADRLIEDYLQYLGRKKSRSELTVESYRSDLHQFTDFLAQRPDAAEDPAVRLLGVTAETAAAYLDSLRADYTRSTLSRKLTAVRGLYGYLLATGKISTNPFDRIRIQPQQTAQPLEFLDESHLQQLFDIVSGSHWLAFRDRAIIAVLYCSGMRVGELLSLTIGDVDAAGAAIHIRTPGRPTRSSRLVPWAWDAVERYLLRRPFRDETDRLRTETLFVNRDGRPLTARSVRRKLADYSRRANLPVEATPAVLRHSCAIHMLRRGDDPKTVRRRLGHLSTSSMRPYLNCLADTPPKPQKPPRRLHAAAR